MNKKQTEAVMAQMEKVNNLLTDLRLSVQYVWDEYNTLYMYLNYWEEQKKSKKKDKKK
jgi:hypothetical protein